jgi:hypothetical protein
VPMTGRPVVLVGCGVALVRFVPAVSGASVPGSVGDPGNRFGLAFVHQRSVSGGEWIAELEVMCE